MSAFRSTTWLLLAVSVSGAAAPSPLDSIQTALDQSCAACHNAQSAAAGVDFAALLGERPLVRNRETWERVISVVEARRMPPESAPQPTDADRETLLAALHAEVVAFDYATIDDPGFEPLRRLTHTEYRNTLRDLFGADLNPTRGFTEEMAGGSGFDNSANTLFLQSSLMERYIVAAERAVEEGIPETPTTAEHRTIRETVLFDGEPEQILRRWLDRAYRRPATEGEVTQAVMQYQQARSAGQNRLEAIKAVLAATLISPKFLFRAEAAPRGPDAEPVGQFELASRLSYFFWATMPDQELFDLARAGRLSEPEVLRAQLDRMLADPKADTLATVFAAQWLGFGQVGNRVRLGPIDFPWCTDSLMDAMRAESSLFFMTLLREDRPIGELIGADYTFINQELAETLYGMDGVEGPEMRRIRLDDPNRGGLLGQGSILAVTSNYNQTSPVKRGHWILDTLLGTPPPPPPPNAGVFDQEVGNQKDLTFREKLAMHSSNESCRSCHAKIDPLGFSLENFDYFGRWRDDYVFRVRIKKADDPNVDSDSNFRKVVKPIDTAGKLPEGAEFVGPSGLKQALLENRRDDLVRQVVSKMLAYALGRQLEYYDEPAVRKIIADLEADDFRFQSLLRGIVESRPFRYKKNPSQEAD